MEDAAATVLPSYAEAMNAKPFDWNAFLDRGDFTEYAWRNAKAKAAKWVTCACGNQCAVIPRLANGAPDDHILFRLGWAFYNAICQRDVSRARYALEDIEKRSAELIAKL